MTLGQDWAEGLFEPDPGAALGPWGHPGPTLEDLSGDDGEPPPGRGRRAFVRTVGALTVAAMVLATVGTTVSALVRPHGPGFSLATDALVPEAGQSAHRGLPGGLEDVTVSLPPGIPPALDPGAGAGAGSPPSPEAATCTLTVRRAGQVVGRSTLEVLWRPLSGGASVFPGRPLVLVAPQGRSSVATLAVPVTGSPFGGPPQDALAVCQPAS